MIPRKPLAPNNGAPNRGLFSQFPYSPKYPKAQEHPSIFTYTSPGRGMNGEHNSGNPSAEELWRSVSTRVKPWAK